MSRIRVLVTAVFRTGRPYYVLPAAAFGLSGYVATSPAWQRFGVGEILLAVALFLCGVASWALNEVADQKSDLPSTAKRAFGLYASGGTGLLRSGAASPRAVLIFALLSGAGGLLIAGSLGWTTVVSCGAFLAIGVCYSLNPIRLKDRGLLGLFSVALAHGVFAYGAGWTAGGGQVGAFPMVHGLLLTIAYFGIEGTAHLLDFEDDLASGTRTAVVELGRCAARNVLSSFQLSAACLLMVLALTDNRLPSSIQAGIAVVAVSLFAMALSTLIVESRSVLCKIRVLGVPVLVALAAVLR